MLNSSILHDHDAFNVNKMDRTQLGSIIQVLKKDSKQRTEKDLNQLIKPLIMRMKFMQDLPDSNDILSVCKSLEYLYHRPGDSVFNQGDFGDKLYIIIKG